MASYNNYSDGLGCFHSAYMGKISSWLAGRNSVPMGSDRLRPAGTRIFRQQNRARNIATALMFRLAPFFAKTNIQYL